PGVEGLDERAVDDVRDPTVLTFERAFAGHEADLHTQELVELETVCGDACVVGRLGSVDAPERLGPRDEPVAVAELRVERIRETPLPRALERGPHDARELPAVDVGLARRRVDGNELPRLVAELAENVDDRVRHLPL